MSMLSEILQRADIQQIRSFLLEGVDCGEIDPRDYETRIRVARGEMTDLLENLIHDPETLDRMVEKIFGYSSEYGDVHMEIGMQAGAKLTAQVLQKITGG